MSAVFEMVKGWEVGQLAALVYKIGEENARRMLSCSKVTVTFKEDEQVACVVAELWQIWKTITIGNIGRDKFIPTLKERGMNVSDWSADMMKQDAFTVVDKEEQIDLVAVSVRDLGFDKATRYDAICTRAKERGLELCPPEVGPQLRLQYLDQPLGEWLVIAMEAIRDSDDDLDVFYVEHRDDGLWLDSYYGNPGSLWNPGRRFVFRARKQPLDT